MFDLHDCCSHRYRPVPCWGCGHFEFTDFTECPDFTEWPLNLQILVSAMVGLWTLRLGSYLVARIHKQGKDSRFDEVKHQPGMFFVYWTMQVWKGVPVDVPVGILVAVPVLRMYLCVEGYKEGCIQGSLRMSSSFFVCLRPSMQTQTRSSPSWAKEKEKTAQAKKPHVLRGWKQVSLGALTNRRRHNSSFTKSPRSVALLLCVYFMLGDAWLIMPVCVFCLTQACPADGLDLYPVVTCARFSTSPFRAYTLSSPVLISLYISSVTHTP
eukprot:1156980-Pelagomonas_calceolata.AAC.7